MRCPIYPLHSRGGCARRLQWVPQLHSETFAQAHHQPYLTLCGGRICSTYRYPTGKWEWGSLGSGGMMGWGGPMEGVWTP